MTKTHLTHVFITLLIGFLFSSCSHYTFRSIEEFNLVDDALQAGEHVKIIYCSGAPDENLNFDYYVHMIGVSQETNDTVNILTLSTYMVERGDLDYYFEPENSDVVKIMQNLEKLTQGTNIADLSTKNIAKVVSNKTTADQAINKYPTALGILAVDIYQEDKENPTTLDDLKNYIY